jgi:N-acetylglucosaminyl-diphospho-decaprenol L-rhamnosyltransferase
MDDLRIQIVNYKTKKYLLECLESVFRDLENSSITYNVAILDNASGDDLSDINSLFPKKNIEIIMSQKNLGFGEGHNVLAQNKEACYLLLLNPDIKIIEPKSIDRLIKNIQIMFADVLGPRLITQENKTQHWDHGELEGPIAKIASAIGRSYWKERGKPLAVAWVSGAVFLIKKDRFDTIGGFDKNFFLYKEEEDVCLRIRHNGGIVFYDPTISVFHYGSVVAKKSEHMENSRAYFMKKHFGKK